MLVLFLYTGLIYTISTGFFQFRHFKTWIHCTLLQAFQKTTDSHAISQFQSLCTALAASMGVGNISGVAIALTVGGPGAVFWMWVSALLGMMTGFAEKVLGIRYRYRDDKGNWVGGAMITIERGLRCRPLAILYALFCMLASFGIGNLAQSNEIANGMSHAFGIHPLLTGACITLLIGFAILEGLKRIARITEKTIPFMSGLYLTGTLIIILSNLHTLPNVLSAIFHDAFRPAAAGIGVGTYSVLTAIRTGVARGVFSNEAGLGSTVAIHSSSDTTEPVIQGMWGILEVFIDTILVCTMTALAILCSGVYPLASDAQKASVELASDAQQIGVELASDALPTGVTLASQAFEKGFSHLFGPAGGQIGGAFLCIAIVFYASATLLGWSVTGEHAARYLFGNRIQKIYRIIFLLCILPGCNMTLELVITASDVMNGCMAIPNLIALLLLAPQVREELMNWKQRNSI